MHAMEFKVVQHQVISVGVRHLAGVAVSGLVSLSRVDVHTNFGKAIKTSSGKLQNLAHFNILVLSTVVRVLGLVVEHRQSLDRISPKLSDRKSYLLMCG